MDWSNLRQFKDDKLNVAEVMLSALNKIEVIVQRKNAGHQHSIPFSIIFSKRLFCRGR